MKNNAFVVVLLCVLVSAPAFAAEKPEPRLITVSGDADIKVVPDEVVVTLGVESFEKTIAVAKGVNDARVKKVMDVLRGLKIEPKHIQTDYMSVEPRYKDGSYTRTWGERRELQGYHVQKTIVVTLKEIAKFEDLMQGVLEAGADHVHGISFRTTELRKHRDAARALAVKAAREKAIALAGDLGQKIGRPQAIHEDYSNWNTWGGWWGGRGWMEGNVAQNAYQNAGPAPSDSGDTIAPGQIRVNARVTVAFELE